ncbi:hypothetical protein TSH100_03940, partial [Azospirillum sp. TSH100]
AKNHGQLMALVDALADLTGMEHDWRDKTLALLVESAVERQQAIASDHPIVDEFWDAVEFMGLAALDHARSKDGIIALNLNQVMAQAQKAGQAMPTLLELKRHLKDARSRPFIEIKTVRSELPGFETVKCWIFKAPKEDRL